MKITFTQVTDETIKTIKESCRQQGFRVGVKRNKQKYAMGSINVYALANQKYDLTPDQTLFLYDLLHDLGLYYISSPIDDYDENMIHLQYHDGFNFWGQVAA